MNGRMLFIDRELSLRLEQAEGYSCAQYAAARRKLFPDSGAEWMQHAGAYAAFDGRESPITQSFGLGLSEPLSASILETFEQFFHAHGARVEHEMSPFAGVEALNLLCARGYQPIEISSMLYRPVASSEDAAPSAPPPPRPGADAQTTAQANVQVRIIDRTEADIWSDVCVRGWASILPDAHDFLREIGTIAIAREGTLCFLASIDGTPGAAGMLCLHQGVALFGGSTTVPELRRRGLQTALLRERLRHAQEAGCDLAMIVAPPGSDSQRNAERAGFRLAYTRTKWRLSHSDPQV